jgi:RNA recognition motif-containing protein
VGVFTSRDLMENRLYVGNLGQTMTSDELQGLFSPYGTVRFAQVIADRDSGRSEGYGFVEMSTPEQAKSAAAALNGTLVGDRTLVVELARRKPGARNRGYHGGPHLWNAQD